MPGEGDEGVGVSEMPPGDATVELNPSATYDAFISYSHTGDADLAKQVQTGLQRLAKP